MTADSKLIAPWSSVKQLWTGAGTGVQESSILTCWIMELIEALHRCPYDCTGPIVETVRKLLIVFADIRFRTSLFFFIVEIDIEYVAKH